MSEYLKLEQIPGYNVISCILEEANNKFSSSVLNNQTLWEVADYIEDRIREAIYNGLLKEVFITPENRLARYEGVKARKDPYNPNRIVIAPFWVYVDEEDEDSSYQDDDDDFWDHYWYILNG